MIPLCSSQYLLYSSVNITGTPTASRDFTITVAVREGAGSRDLPTQVSRSFTMRVRPRVTVSAIGNITVTQNTAITPIQVSASGGQTSYSFSMSSNPASSSLSINENSGQITGTPTQTGTFTLTVTVTDDHGRTGTRSFSMTVNAPTPVSTPLTIAEINDIAVKISGVQTNSPITPIQVSASGGQTPYTYSMSQQSRHRFWSVHQFKQRANHWHANTERHIHTYRDCDR